MIEGSGSKLWGLGLFWGQVARPSLACTWVSCIQWLSLQEVVLNSEPQPAVCSILGPFST